MVFLLTINIWLMKSISKSKREISTVIAPSVVDARKMHKQIKGKKNKGSTNFDNINKIKTRRVLHDVHIIIRACETFTFELRLCSGVEKMLRNSVGRVSRVYRIPVFISRINQDIRARRLYEIL